eukprot:1077602-Lingulodinium_polyedra.AAC.1
MMRSNRPSEHQSWCLRGVWEACDFRAVVAADGRIDRIIARGFKNRANRTIAHLNANAKTGIRMECASV